MLSGTPSARHQRWQRRNGTAASAGKKQVRARLAPFLLMSFYTMKLDIAWVHGYYMPLLDMYVWGFDGLVRVL